MRRPAGRLQAVRGGVVLILVGAVLGMAAPVCAEVPTGMVTPKIAPVGAWIRVMIEGECDGVPAEQVRVRFVSRLAADQAPSHASRVEADEQPGYRLRVPDIPAGPYHVYISCGGEPFGFTDNGSGPMFTVLPQVTPGAAAWVYLFDPCGSIGDGPVWAEPRILLAGSPDITVSDDPRLAEAAVLEHLAETEGFFVRVGVPALAPGSYHVYSACAGELRLQDIRGPLEDNGTPVVEIAGTPDTATEPAPGGPEPAAALLVLVAGLASALAFAVRVRTRA